MILTPKYFFYISKLGLDICAYCGIVLTKDTFTLDHIFPRSKGGSNRRDNKVPCCLCCNRRKTNKKWHVVYYFYNNGWQKKDLKLGEIAILKAMNKNLTEEKKAYAKENKLLKTILH